MRLRDIELTILVKGRPITEYGHQGQTFVEGRAGSEYEIEVRNHSYQRVEAVLSVDGLSVIDGKPAGHQSQGYLINARDVVRVPGWMLNAATVAKFAFSGQAQSYTAQAGGDTRNNGVIGVMTYCEKPRPMLYNTLLAASPTLGRGIAPSSYNTTNTTNTQWSSVGIGSSVGSSETMRGEALNAADCFVAQSLGTAFGESAEFATRTVTFERGDLLTTLLCYYDEKRGLKARGIKMERRSRQKPPQPQAFPALAGCQPPAGWQG